LPFDDFRVKLELDPESVYVARVWVDQVPAERRPPVELALIVALVGILPAGPVEVGPPEEVVLVGVPDLSGYLIPLVGQEPALGALIGTNVPSITEPLRWK